MSTMISNAVIRWTSEFQKLVAKDISAADAMREIARSNPDLHDAFLDALRSIHSNEDAKIDAVTEANRRIAQRMKRGLSRPKAIAAVMREDPDLHAAYLSELGKEREA